MAGLIGRIAREVRLVRNVGSLIRRVGRLKPNSPHTVADIIEHWARVSPNRTAIVFEDRQYTYREYDANANRYARWAQSLGLKRGDAVALLEGHQEVAVRHQGQALGIGRDGR